MAEQWFPNTVWYDNLDVLGSDAYQQPGVHVDPNMASSWQVTMWALLQERDLTRLLFYAQTYDTVGFPIAAQALRDRALAITVWLDPGLPEEERRKVEGLIQYETRPDMLVVAARGYEAKGFGYAGNVLRERAALIRIARRRSVPAPEIVWPWRRAAA